MNKLRDDLTHDEFIALANREPNLDGNWIYRLEMTALGNGPHNYPCYKVGETTQVDFTSLNQAELYMREQSALTAMYRSRITQIPIGGTADERGAQWLYDGGANPIDCTITHKAGSAEETHFFGRPIEKQRFAPGDVIELLQGDTVSLGIVFFPIRPPEESWNLYYYHAKDYELSYKSDSYAIVIDDSGVGTHALATALMPPRFPVPQELRNEVDRWFDAVFEKALLGESSSIKAIPVLDEDDEDIPADGVPISDEELEELMSQPVRKIKGNAKLINENPYGMGENPPYTLYQADNGKWGLIDGAGKHLDAIFDRLDGDRFSQAPWEVVTFDPQEGFELLAWYDPCEVWFNFTWEDAAYPDEFAGLLWQNSKNEVGHYKDTLYSLIPSKDHWLIDEILNVDNLDRMEDDEFYWLIDTKLASHPQLADASVTNPMLDPIMRNPQTDNDIKIALWKAKVRFDYHFLRDKDDYQAEI